MVSPEMQVSGRYGTHSPLSLRGEGLPLIVRGGSNYDLVSMFVNSACGGSSDLTLFLGLLLYLCYLLSLLRGSTDLHTKDNVPDLRLGQAGHIHTANTHTHTHTHTSVLQLYLTL